MNAQTANQNLIQTLISEIKKLSVDQLPVEMRLWEVDDIAAYLNLSPDYIKRYVITQKTFPPLRAIPTNLSGDRYSSRWRASEVIAWCMTIDKSTFDASQPMSTRPSPTTKP